MARVLVTGGGGFVGGAIVRALLRRGDEVTVLGRRRYPRLEALGVRCIRGDLADKQAVMAAAAGSTLVFHVAAKAGIWGRRADYHAANVIGTENVLAACRACGIPYLVHTSTPSVVFAGRDIEGGDTLPYADRFLCHYAATKAKAERLVLEANSGNLRTVALRPHLVWGPGDTNLIPRLLDRARRGRLVRVGDGRNRVDISYIDNVVDAHLLAARELMGRGRNAGRGYFISQGEPVNLWDWIGDFLERAGAPPVTKAIGYRAAYLTGALFECLYTVFRVESEPPMTRFLAEQLAKSHWFSIAGAGRDFGYVPGTSAAEGMERLVAALRGSAEPAAAPPAGDSGPTGDGKC